MPLLLLLFIVPLIEVALFIEVGSIIGVWPTIASVILTAVLGSYLLRRQGLAALRDVQSRLAAGVNPGRLLADGAMLIVAGVFLLTPGFLTDAIGLLLLVPPVRAWLFKRFAARYRLVETRHQGRPAGSGGTTINGEFEEIHPWGGAEGSAEGEADHQGDTRPPIGRDPN